MDFSIIIPCYNSGSYLKDAVDSVAVATKDGEYLYEIIIVDDGSTQPATLQLLNELEAQQKYTVLRQANGGPAAARNTGIKKATGKFFVFLDSDNKLKPWFFEKTLRLQEQTNADIIHCKSDFFGDATEPRFHTGPFDIHKIIRENYIDICCLIKREVFDKTGGLDESRLLIGFEDWEFFVRAYSLGVTFAYMEEPVYDYRILGNSVSQQHSYERIQEVKQYVYKKYLPVLMSSFEWYCLQHKIHHSDRQRPLRSFMKYMYHKYWRPAH